MADVDGTNGDKGPGVGNEDATDGAAEIGDDTPTRELSPAPHPEAAATSMNMDDIFRPAHHEETGVTVPITGKPEEECCPKPGDVIPLVDADGAAEAGPHADAAEVAGDPDVEAEVVEDADPAPIWKRKWFIGVVAALIGVGIGAVVWGSSRDGAAVPQNPPLIATPASTTPSAPQVTVTETTKATATATQKVETTATKKVETTATETSKVQVTTTETTKVKSTATETLKINSTATETVKVPADPAPTVIFTVTEPVIRENSQGLRAEAATEACADATQAKLESENPGSQVIVQRTEPLVAALRNDVDAWFIKIGASVDASDQVVECNVSGSDTAPVVTSIVLR